MGGTYQNDFTAIAEICQRAQQRIGALLMQSPSAITSNQINTTVTDTATKLSKFSNTLREMGNSFKNSGSSSNVTLLQERIESQKAQNRELKKRLRETKQSLKDES